jgi:hypothetical protein
VVAFLTRIDGNDLVRLAAPASPDVALVPRQQGGEAEAAGGKGALGMKPAVAGGAKDLGPAELKELEFAPERPAAELPEAKFPPAEPLAQLVGVTGAQRLEEHERLRLTGAIVASLRFSDLYCTQAPHRFEVFEEKDRPGNFPEPAFAGVRGADALGKLPEAERPAWQKLWEEVESLRRRPGVASRWACTVVCPDP